MVIVGAGFTGLWTALSLAAADPALRIVVCEQEFAGFGASGRNGGWCSELFPTSWPRIAAASGRGAALALKSALAGSVAAILDCCTEWNVPAARAGTLSFARTPGQLVRAREEVASARSWGDPDVLLSAAEVAERAHVRGVRGAVFSPACAAIDPGRLVRELALAVERAGVRIYESTPVVSLAPGVVRTARGSVRAPVVIRATEAYTARLPGHTRAVAPVYSLIVATEPLSADVLDEVGLAEGATFTDFRRTISYGQRTADGRMVFGGRGAPYHWGSQIRPSFDRVARVFARLRADLKALFPVLDGVRFTHAWGGPLGVPRDWHAAVAFDPASGMGAAGGYVGDGVATSHLAGRTLADLILRRSTALTSLPWVGHRSPAWEREPWRWLGINVGLSLARAADAADARGLPFPLSGLLDRLTGG